MTDAPHTDVPAKYQRVRIAAPASSAGPVRRYAAEFWLNFMFFMANRAPWFLRATRGFFLWWAWNTSRHCRDVTLANARRLLGEGSTPRQQAQLAMRALGSFFDFVYDIGRTLNMTPEQLQGQIASIEGKERYLQARAAGKGAIIATAHMGSFELGMCAMLQVEKGINVVFQRDARSLFERLRSDFRRRMNIREAAIDDGWPVWMRLRDALLNDEVVAMQADRAMPGQMGVKVPFLGGHSLFPEGPAKLAAITGSPIIPVFTVRQPDGRVACHIEAPIELTGSDELAINAAIAKLAVVVGRYVAAHPHQWLVLQRAWCEDMAEGCPEAKA